MSRFGYVHAGGEGRCDGIAVGTKAEERIRKRQVVDGRAAAQGSPPGTIHHLCIGAGNDHRLGDCLGLEYGAREGVHPELLRKNANWNDVATGVGGQPVDFTHDLACRIAQCQAVVPGQSV